MHVEEGQVHGGTTCVAGFLHNVQLIEEDALVQVGIEIGSHEGVGDIGSPSYKMIYAFLRPVGIVDFQPVSFFEEFVAHGLQGFGGRPGEQGRGLLIAVDPFADEIVRGEIANFQNRVRNDIADGDELAAVLGGTDGTCLTTVRGKKGHDQKGKCVCPYHGSIGLILAIPSSGNGRW